MSEIKIRLETLDGYLELIDRLEEEFPNRRFVPGSVSSSWWQLDDSQGLKRYSDFVFPSELFEDPETTEDVKQASTDLLGTALIPTEFLDETAKNIISYEELRGRVETIAQRFDNPAFLMGGWSPDGNWQMTGNPDNNKPRRISEVYFEEDVFDTSLGCEPLKKIHTGLFATCVVPESLLTDAAVEYERGQRDELPLEERDTGPEPEELNEKLRSASPGDRVTPNDRNRALEVISPEESSRIGIANKEVLFLRGNGTEYRISIREGKYPKLDWSSDSEYIGEVEVEQKERIEA